MDIHPGKSCDIPSKGTANPEQLCREGTKEITTLLIPPSPSLLLPAGAPHYTTPTRSQGKESSLIFFLGQTRLEGEFGRTNGSIQHHSRGVWVMRLTVRMRLHLPGPDINSCVTMSQLLPSPSSDYSIHEVTLALGTCGLAIRSKDYVRQLMCPVLQPLRSLVWPGHCCRGAASEALGPAVPSIFCCFLGLLFLPCEMPAGAPSTILAQVQIRSQKELTIHPGHNQ